MTIRPNRLAASLAIASVLAFSAVGAQAASYTFSQGGFTGGGSLTGSFSGVDSDANGLLDASPSPGVSEITAFSLSFSGDSQVANFTLGYSDLAGLVWDLGQGAFIGNNGAVGTGEGIAAFSTDVMYLTGIGPNGVAGGAVSDFNTGGFTSTTQMVSVSAVPVPEPETWAMLLVGLGLVAIVSRRRGKDIAIW
jgi:hypothetical protein